jgi:hypothetical protein
MAFKEGEEVQAKHRLSGGWLKPDVGEGKTGRVVKVSGWSNKIEVEFNGTRYEVTDKDIKPKGFWS